MVYVSAINKLNIWVYLSESPECSGHLGRAGEVMTCLLIWITTPGFEIADHYFLPLVIDSRNARGCLLVWQLLFYRLLPFDVQSSQ